MDSLTAGKAIAIIIAGGIGFWMSDRLFWADWSHLRIGRWTFPRKKPPPMLDMQYAYLSRRFIESLKGSLKDDPHVPHVPLGREFKRRTL